MLLFPQTRGSKQGTFLLHQRRLNAQGVGLLTERVRSLIFADTFGHSENHCEFIIKLLESNSSSQSSSRSKNSSRSSRHGSNSRNRRNRRQRQVNRMTFNLVQRFGSDAPSSEWKESQFSDDSLRGDAVDVRSSQTSPRPPPSDRSSESSDGGWGRSEIG